MDEKHHLEHKSANTDHKVKDMATKRDWQGNTKGHHGGGPKLAPRPKQNIVKNAYTPMFERLRDELDQHHDRRDRLGKASRDVTALSKKIIFSLQRVRKIEKDFPQAIQTEVDSRLSEIAKLLAVIAPEIQGINRYRYERSLSCLEELIEALTFCHYIKTQTLASLEQMRLAVEELACKGAVPEDEVMTGVEETAPQPEKTAEKEAPTVSITEDDYLYGVFDLTGEMMRFATTTAALSGGMASAADGDGDEPRTIVQDIQEIGSFIEMLPLRSGHRTTWEKKVEVMRQSIEKVEKLGYGWKIRGSERPAGWVPDLSAGDQGDLEE